MRAGLADGGRLTVGVDLDNTIVSYDSLLHDSALELGLIDSGVVTSKREVRDAVRGLQDGDILWQKLQGLVYGPRMREATLIDGVKKFFYHCKQHDVSVHIVSHKTAYAPYDDTKTNLREAALTWMSGQGLLEPQTTGLTEKSVYFEPSRQEKLARIAQLGCTHFIDDLEETFLEDNFPRNVKKILFSPNPQNLPLTEATVLTSWKEIKDHLFVTAN